MSTVCVYTLLNIPLGVSTIECLLLDYKMAVFFKTFVFIDLPWKI